MKRLWLVGLGKHGEQGKHALDTGQLVLGSQFGDRATPQRTPFSRPPLGRAEILDALFEVYDRLPEEFRAGLPLRRTWMLVRDDDEASA